MFTIRDLAKELKISDVTIRRYIDTGQIKVIRIGGIIRITDEEVNRIKKEGIKV